MLLAQSRHETALGKEWMSVKISHLHLSDFMLFQQADFQWSPGINVICGTNSTGKTALIKLMYSLHKSYEQWNSTETKEAAVNRFSEKLCGVFRPDNGKLGRLVRRKQGSAQMTASMSYENGTSIDVNFGNRASKIATLILPKMEHTASPDHTAAYFPPKEIISATENFTSLYEEYHIAFEETYYDLAKLLDRPLKRGKNSDEQNQVLASLDEILHGTTVQHDKKFYLSAENGGEFEMGLVSEGYRKLATITYLIRNGCLNANSVLFWDEPETNMNPGMIRPLVDAMMQLAKLKVQIFITTHDYFLQQYLNMYMAFPESNTDQIDIRFFSLFFEDGAIKAEMADTISELQHNIIMEEFDAIYNREQGFIYDRIRE